MFHPTPKGIVLAAAVFLCVILIPWAIKSLFSLGGEPKESGATVHYRIKPMMLAIFWMIALAGLAAIWSGVGDVRSDHIAPGFFLIVIGVAGIGLVIMGQNEIILDQVGIHSRSPFFGETVIAWNDLSHFERFYNSRAVTTTYFFRSKTGTSIGAGDSSFDTADLLRRIQTHHALEEQPYKRRKWYGG